MVESATVIPLTHRFVSEDMPSLAAYVGMAVHALEKEVSGGVAIENASATAALAESLKILRRVKWQLAGDTSSYETSAAGIAEAESAFSAESRCGTAEAPRAAIDAAILEQELRKVVPEAGDLVVNSVRTLDGGRSKLTALVSQSGCNTLPECLVFRQDWASAVTGTSVKTEFELLQRVHAAGICAPKPFHYQPDGNALGSAYLLVERLDGKVHGDIFEPPHSEQLALQLADQLGKLHSLPRADFEGLNDLADRDYGGAALGVRIAEHKSINDAIGHKMPIIDAAFAWLEANSEKMAGPKTLVHGDLGFHNFLADGDDLTAILDWELAHLGNPAEDLGYIKGDIERIVDWEQFLERYRVSGGPALASSDIDFYFVWGLTRLYCLLLQARAGLRAGLVQDVSIARVCSDATPRLIAILANGLHRIAGIS